MSSNVFPMALVKGVARHQIPQIDDDCASGWEGECVWAGTVGGFGGVRVGLKLIALWLATLCKIGGMQCSELLKEFRNSFCFLPAALDFEQLFLLAHFLCARQSAANFYSILHSVCATLGFSGTPPSLLPAILLPTPTLFPYAALLHAFLALCFWQFVLHCRRQRKSQ